MEPTNRQSEPVLVAMSILGGLQVFLGGAAGVSYFADNPLFAAVCAMGTLAVGAATFGVQFYVRGQVVPVENVVARVSPATGEILTGDAAPPAGQNIDDI